WLKTCSKNLTVRALLVSEVWDIGACVFGLMFLLFLGLRAALAVDLFYRRSIPILDIIEAPCCRGLGREEVLDAGCKLERVVHGRRRSTSRRRPWTTRWLQAGGRRPWLPESG